MSNFDYIEIVNELEELRIKRDEYDSCDVPDNDYSYEYIESRIEDLEAMIESSDFDEIPF